MSLPLQNPPEAVDVLFCQSPLLLSWTVCTSGGFRSPPPDSWKRSSGSRQWPCWGGTEGVENTIWGNTRGACVVQAAIGEEEYPSHHLAYFMVSRTTTPIDFQPLTPTPQHLVPQAHRHRRPLVCAGGRYLPGHLRATEACQAGMNYSVNMP